MVSLGFSARALTRSSVRCGFYCERVGGGGGCFFLRWNCVGNCR